MIAYAVPSSESNSTTATKDQHPLKNPSKDSTEETYLVNPVLTVTDPRPPSAWDAEYESCESIPGYNALVKRAASVSVQALDLKGSSITLKASGLLARILQHEVDHLQGILLTDRMEPKSLRHDEVSILALLGMHIKQCLMPYDEQYIGEYEMQTRR